MQKELSKKGDERLRRLYIDNNLNGENTMPTHFCTLVKYGYASNDYIDGKFIRRVNAAGIDYLKQKKLIT